MTPNRVDLTKLKFGDVVEGPRGDRLMIILPAGRGRTAWGVYLRPDRESSGDRKPGQTTVIYSSWDLTLLS